MKSATVLSFASSALAAGTLEFALFKQAKPHLISQSSRRDVFDTSLFTDDGRAYFLNISVGTPSQPQTVLLDTGSSDLFVTSSTAAYCQNHTCMGGTFDISKSSTAQIVAPDVFNISFVDGSSDAGDLISDVVQIRDRAINVTMGLARNVKPHRFQWGLLGLGYSAKEGSAMYDGIRYPNFVETLVNAGEIASRFFSLYLSNLGRYGSMVFGGVDTQKFEGDLVTLNCMPAHGYVYDFVLSMPNVTMVDENGTTVQLVNETNAQYGLFDSGSSPWLVKDTVYQQIVDLTGFVYSPEAEIALRPCVEVSNTTAFDFQFRGFHGNNATQAHLKVLLSQMVIPLLPSEAPYTDPSGNTYCALAIVPTKSNRGNIWGDAIMRAGYFVFDLDNGQVSLGQARHSNESNIVAVQAGPHGLANAINQPSYAQTAQTYSPMPFATDFSRSASVSTANITIGVVTISAATDPGDSQSSRRSLPASVSWNNDSTDSNTTLCTSLVAASTVWRTTYAASSTISSTPSAISSAIPDILINIPNIAPSAASAVSSNTPKSFSPGDSPSLATPQAFL